MESMYTTDIVGHGLNLKTDDEVTVTIPLSLYKEMLEICKLYRQQNSYCPNYNPDPVVPDYTRPQPNDWPFYPRIWC